MRNILQTAYNWIKNTEKFSVFLYALPAVIIVAVLYWIVRRTKQSRILGNSFKAAIMAERCLPNEIIRLFFVFWIAVMICLTLLPVNFFGSIWYFAAYGGEWQPFSLSKWKWNFIPLILRVFLPDSQMTGLNITKDFLELFENSLLFIPLGFALPLILKEISFTSTMLTGFVCTTFIELIQPFTGRNGCIDDIIFNTFSVFIGYFLYALMKNFLPDLTKKFQFTPNIPRRYKV